MHSSLRSFNFWRVILINFMVSSFVYMSMPLWPLMLQQNEGVPLHTSGWMMLFFCVGLFVPGAMSSYLVDKYRRKDVCFVAISLLVSVSILSTLDLPPALIGFLKFLQGASFSMFHAALGSTILIDITISERRNLAAYIYFWASRFALALGPAFGILALKPELWQYLKYFPIACALVSVYFVLRIDLPFRAPYSSPRFSLDRFWLKQGWPLVLLFLPVTFSLGVVMTLNLYPMFFVCLFGGFLLSIILHFIVFQSSDVRAEMFTGFLMLVVSVLLLVVQDEEIMVRVSAILAGYGVGCVSSRIQTFLTIISKHTERGSAQGTYKLTFESGLCLGVFFACLVHHSGIAPLYGVCLFMLMGCMLAYVFLVHHWFERHPKR